MYTFKLFSANQPHLKSMARLYLSIVLVWFLLVVILISFIINNDLNKAEQQFNKTADSLFEHLNNNVVNNESIIEGFASLLSSTRKNEQQRVRNYARRILERYPHIFMFEIAERVEKRELPEFIEYMRSSVYDKYRVAAFDFDNSREWKKLPDKPVYFPITFIEPMYESSMAVLGLDLNSNYRFREALQASAMRDMPVVSAPFDLIEGERAFLLHRMVDSISTTTSRSKQQYALIVVKAETLLPRRLTKSEDLSVRVYHQKYDDTEQGRLIYREGDPESQLEQWLFPCLSYVREVSSVGQPFVMHLEKQLGFDDINLWLLLLVTVLAGISFWMVMVYSKMHHQHEIQRLHYQNELYHLANNDSLTGLVNRNFLLDRMRQVIARAKRKNVRFAIFFMDMDNFKAVNDNYGHAAGDQLLRYIAERFKACMREEDTVCRYHGDEFVILVEEVNSEDEIDQIRSKLQQSLSRPFNIDGNEIYASVSIGVAAYPDDGDCVEGLLHVADQYMYRAKKNVESN